MEVWPWYAMRGGVIPPADDRFSRMSAVGRGLPPNVQGNRRAAMALAK
jgi:hypothetical protein